MENGLVQSLLSLSQKEVKPIKQFILQLLCEIIGYSSVPEAYTDLVLLELVGCIGNICWRGSVFEAITRWMNRESALVEKAILRIDFQPLLARFKETFENMQDNFLLQLYRLSQRKESIAKHLSKSGILLFLCTVTSQNATILIDLLRLLKLFFLTDSNVNAFPLEMLKKKVESLLLFPSILVQEAAKSLSVLIKTRGLKGG